MIDIKINSRIYNLSTLAAELSKNQILSLEENIFAVRNKEAGTAAAMLGLLAGVPERKAVNIDPESLHTLLVEYLIPLAEQAVPRKEAGFEWGCEKFLFPAWGKDMTGQRIPLYETPAGELCEVSNLQDTNKNLYAPLITAILCRSAGEKKYDRQTIWGRTEMFGELPQDISDRVVSELKLAHRYMKQAFPYAWQYTRNNSWNDLLFFIARYIPSETTVTKEMNCYDFIKLADSRLRSKS